MNHIKNMFVYELLNDREDNIEGDNFKRFLLHCLEQSTYFSVTSWEKKGTRIIPELNGSFYQSFQTHLWYCCKTGKEQPLNIMLYHSSPSLLDGILKYFDRLFPECIYRNGIEDICFFQNNRLLFGSVSHEHIAGLVLTSEAKLKAYEKFAAWKKVELTARDYEFYPDLGDRI